MGGEGSKRMRAWKVKEMGESIGVGSSVIQRSMVVQQDLIHEEAVLTTDDDDVAKVCASLTALANLNLTTKKGIEH